MLKRHAAVKIKERKEEELQNLDIAKNLRCHQSDPFSIG